MLFLLFTVFTDWLPCCNSSRQQLTTPERRVAERGGNMGRRRVIAMITAMALLGSIATGCQSYRRVPSNSVESRAREIRRNGKIRFVDRTGARKEMVVREIEYPIVTGYEIGGKGKSVATTVDLREVELLEISDVNYGASAFVLVGVAVVLTTATLLGMIGASDSGFD